MIYAIDFGTTNSLLGAVIDGKMHSPIPLDPFAKDPSILRSVLFFPDRNHCYYGAEAIQEFAKHDMEGRFIRSIKKFLPIRSFLGTQIGNTPLSLEEIIATFLREMRARANQHFGKNVESVLLGRPAQFSPIKTEDDFAQSRLEYAAKLAGFKNIQFCPEPIAAAYDFRTQLQEPKIVLVADFGGGTSDFTVIRIGKEKYKPSDVLSIGGVSLAGDALDGAIMRKRIAKHFGSSVTYKAPLGSNILTMPKHLMENICSPADISLLRERDTMEFFKNVRSWSLGAEDKQKIDNLFDLIQEQMGFDLFEEIERTKRALSKKEFENFSFSHSGIQVNERISREEFDQYTGESIRKILSSLDRTLQDAQLDADKIDLVYATGGTAKVLSIQKALELRFGVQKVQQQNNFHSIVQGLIKMAADKNFI